jgi:hypothetical protein
MCTWNKIPRKLKSVTGWKICQWKKNWAGNDTKQLGSLYFNYTWKKGTNTAKLATTHSETGFHCFQYKKDALKFVYKINSSRSVFYQNGLVLIKVTLLPTTTKAIVSGRNEITNPVFDCSPCYQAPVAIWDGKYTELN